MDFVKAMKSVRIKISLIFLLMGLIRCPCTVTAGLSCTPTYRKQVFYDIQFGWGLVSAAVYGHKTTKKKLLRPVSSFIAVISGRRS